MSRRGAGSAAKRGADFVCTNGASDRAELLVTPALGRPVIQVARALLAQGLTSAEVCSLFTHVASTLARQTDGLPDREWLALCQQLLDEDSLEQTAPVTSPGGSA